MSRLDFAVLALGAELLLQVAGVAQANPQADFSPTKETSAAPALVQSVKISPAGETQTLEIITTRPLIPSVTPLENPSRLVVDLQNSVISAPERIRSAGGQISGVRVNQFQKDPPVARIVMDLSRPSSYSWDEAGNRLMIRVQRPAASPPAQSDMPAVAERDEEGSIELASLREKLPVNGNSSLSAGSDSALLRMPRGGQVRVCPGTTISMTASQDGSEMMLGMSTGALETHYQLESSEDSVLTPDFRIVPAGAGQFDFAISADSRGNTCVRALPGNTASAVVSELMGDTVYEVKPSEQALFREGRAASPGKLVPADCGCSSGRAEVLRAAALPSRVGGNPGSLVAPDAIPSSRNRSETAPLPPSQAKETHVQIDAPFVFRASDAETAAPAQEAESLPPEGSRRLNLMEITVFPPQAAAPAPAAPEHRSVLGKIGSFFAGLFR